MNPVALYFGLYPMVATTIAFLGSFVVFLGMWLLRSPAEREAEEHPFFIAFFYRMIGPICRLLEAMRISPNVVTLSSLVFALVGAAALGAGQFMLAAWLILCATATDAMDGFLARAMGTSSPAGAFLDSFIDRVTEGVIFLGFAWLGNGDWLTFFSFAALISSFAVSYARARGESLGATGNFGLMSRPVRLTIVVISVFVLAWSELVGPALGSYAMPVVTSAIGFLSVAAGVTAVRRARGIFLELLDEPTGSPDTLESELREQPVS